MVCTQKELQNCDGVMLLMFSLFDLASCFDCQHTNALKTLVENGGTRKMKCNLNTSEAYGSLTEHISESQRLKSSG